MAFRTITNLSCDTTITIGGFNKKLKKDNPTQIEGYYLGKKKVADAKKKSGFSYLYTLQTSKGNVGVWGRTDLDRQLAQVSAGTMVRISAAGTIAVPTGEMYKYKVEADDDNTIEVSAEVESSDSSYSDDDDTVISDYVGSRLDEDSLRNPHSGSSVDSLDEDEDVVQAQELLAAEQKAKVAALLKGRLKAKT